MIRSFADRDTERLSRRESVRRFPAALQRTMLRRLVTLDAADTIGDLKSPPDIRIEKLRGTRARQHSIRVEDHWRVCFRWRNGDAHGVEIVADK